MDTAIRRRLASFYGHSPCFLAFCAMPAAVPPCVVGSGTPRLPCRHACRRCRSAYGMQAHRLPAAVLSIKGGKTSFQFSILKWNHKAHRLPAAGADPVLCGHALPTLPPSLLRFYIGKRHSPACLASSFYPAAATGTGFRVSSISRARGRACMCMCVLAMVRPAYPAAGAVYPAAPALRDPESESKYKFFEPTNPHKIRLSKYPENFFEKRC